MKGFVQFIGIQTDEKIAVFFAESLLCLSYLRIITIFTIYTFWMIRSNSYTNRTFDALTSKSFADSLKLTNIFFFRSILNIIGFSLMLQDIVGNESLFLQLGNRLGQFIIQIASLSQAAISTPPTPMGTKVTFVVIFSSISLSAKRFHTPAP